MAFRASLGLPSEHTTGFRLVNAEGDGLPGLIVDRYGDVLAVQLGTIGMKQREALVHEALWTLLQPRAIVDRTSLQTAKAEKFEPSVGVVRGADLSVSEYVERGLRYVIPLEIGQKTGFYFDQRALRARVEQLAHGRRVLDAYAFVGPFALAAARGGATEVVAVDDSALAVEVGAECARANGLGDRVRFIKQDARKALTEAKGAFDLVVADPPRMAANRGARRERARRLCEARGERLPRRPSRRHCGAVLVLRGRRSSGADAGARPGGDARECASDGHRAVVQGADHPVPAAFGEGLYLKAVIAHVDPR